MRSHGSSRGRARWRETWLGRGTSSYDSSKRKTASPLGKASSLAYHPTRPRKEILSDLVNNEDEAAIVGGPIH